MWINQQLDITACGAFKVYANKFVWKNVIKINHFKKVIVDESLENIDKKSFGKFNSSLHQIGPEQEKKINTSANMLIVSSNRVTSELE